MVQWTDKPARKPQAVAEEVKPEVAPRPVVVVRKARRSGFAGVVQVLTICCVFGLIVASVFMFKEMRATQNAPAVAGVAPIANERDPATGRIVVMDRDQCRELDFHNQSGKTVHKGAVSCHDTPHASAANNSLYRHPTNRLEHIRRSFAQ
jgi:hypothetical protein